MPIGPLLSWIWRYHLLTIIDFRTHQIVHIDQECGVGHVHSRSVKHKSRNADRPLALMDMEVPPIDHNRLSHPSDRTYRSGMWSRPRAFPVCEAQEQECR